MSPPELSSGNSNSTQPNQWGVLQNLSEPNWDILQDAPEPDWNTLPSHNATSINNPAELQQEAFEQLYHETSNERDNNSDPAETRRFTEILAEAQHIIEHDQKEGTREQPLTYPQVLSLLTSDAKNAFMITSKRNDAGDAFKYSQKIRDIETIQDRYDSIYQSLAKASNATPESINPTNSSSNLLLSTVKEQPPQLQELPGDVIS